MIIRFHTSYGELGVSSEGKNYDYFGVYEFEYSKLKKMLNRKLIGQAWKYLKKFSKPEWTHE